MYEPFIASAQEVAPQTTILPSFLPVPGFGILAVNAFVIEADEPVLVDTGMAAITDEFMDSLRQVIEPHRLRWLWLTHPDPDHMGSYERVLAEAPQARVVTSFVGMAKLGLLGRTNDRVYLINPGQSLDVGDRRLRALRPASFDAPETTGFFDEKTCTLFSADSFGALLDEAVEDAGAVAPRALRDGMVLWTTIDSPWMHLTEERLLDTTLAVLDDLQADLVLSSHLPPARGQTRDLLSHIAAARTATPFVGPDQDELMAMMAPPPPPPQAPVERPRV